MIKRPNCCSNMIAQIDMECTIHGNTCPDQVVRFVGTPYTEKGRCAWNPDDIVAYRLWNVHLIAENATYSCYYCPWCGTQIPQDQRESLV